MEANGYVLSVIKYNHVYASALNLSIQRDPKDFVRFLFLFIEIDFTGILKLFISRFYAV